jgi:hypothetical protein
MAVRLRYLAHDLIVPLGRFVIGRSTDCQLSLEDPLVSRRHARITVEPERVLIEDLASRNGVLVNGEKITGLRQLASGDRIEIGSQALVIELSWAREAMPTMLADETSAATVLRRAELRDDEEEPTYVGSRAALQASVSHPDQRVNALSLIGGVADKALALGRISEAERILSGSLHEILDKLSAGEPAAAELIERAGFYASRLAAATENGQWVDYIFALFSTARRLMPARLVDELYAIGRKVHSVDKSKVRRYVAQIGLDIAVEGPAERFLQQRIEGLERLLALK